MANAGIKSAGLSGLAAPVRVLVSGYLMYVRINVLRTLRFFVSAGYVYGFCGGVIVAQRVLVVFCHHAGRDDVMTGFQFADRIIIA